MIALARLVEPSISVKKMRVTSVNSPPSFWFSVVSAIETRARARWARFFPQRAHGGASCALQTLSRTEPTSRKGASTPARREIERAHSGDVATSDLGESASNGAGDEGAPDEDEKETREIEEEETIADGLEPMGVVTLRNDDADDPVLGSGEPPKRHEIVAAGDGQGGPRACARGRGRCRRGRARREWRAVRAARQSGGRLRKDGVRRPVRRAKEACLRDRKERSRARRPPSNRRRAPAWRGRSDRSRGRPEGRWRKRPERSETAR